jgi:hypothetical protein
MTLETFKQDQQLKSRPLSPLVLEGTISLATEEFLLNLHRDLIQPFFSAICPIFVLPDRCLELSHPVFSGSQLSR